MQKIRESHSNNISIISWHVCIGPIIYRLLIMNLHVQNLKGFRSVINREVDNINRSSYILVKIASVAFMSGSVIFFN